MAWWDSAGLRESLTLDISEFKNSVDQAAKRLTSLGPQAQITPQLVTNRINRELTQLGRKLSAITQKRYDINLQLSSQGEALDRKIDKLKGNLQSLRIEANRTAQTMAGINQPLIQPPPDLVAKYQAAARQSKKAIPQDTRLADLVAQQQAYTASLTRGGQPFGPHMVPDTEALMAKQRAAFTLTNAEIAKSIKYYDQMGVAAGSLKPGFSHITSAVEAYSSSLRSANTAQKALLDSMIATKQISRGQANLMTGVTPSREDVFRGTQSARDWQIGQAQATQQYIQGMSTLGNTRQYVESMSDLGKAQTKMATQMAAVIPPLQLQQALTKNIGKNLIPQTSMWQRISGYIKGTTSPTSQVVQHTERISQHSERISKSSGNWLQNLTRSMWASFKIGMAFSVVYRTINAIETVFWGIVSALKNAFKQADEFQVRVASIAGIITSMSKSKNPVGEVFQAATQYAEVAQEILLQVSAKTAMTIDELGLVFQSFVNMHLRPETVRQFEIMGEVATAVKALTQGQPFEKQAFSEIRALFTGNMAGGSAQLLQNLKSIDKNFLTTFKDLRKMAQLTGDFTPVFNYLSTSLKGMHLTMLKMQNTWTGVLTTFESILIIVSRIALKDVLATSIKSLRIFNESLFDPKTGLTKRGAALAESLRDIWMGIVAVSKLFVAMLSNDLDNGTDNIKAFMKAIVGGITGFALAIDAIIMTVRWAFDFFKWILHNIALDFFSNLKVVNDAVLWVAQKIGPQVLVNALAEVSHHLASEAGKDILAINESAKHGDTLVRAFADRCIAATKNYNKFSAAIGKHIQPRSLNDLNAVLKETSDLIGSLGDTPGKKKALSKLTDQQREQLKNYQALLNEERGLLIEKQTNEKLRQYIIDNANTVTGAAIDQQRKTIQATLKAQIPIPYAGSKAITEAQLNAVKKRIGDETAGWIHDRAEAEKAIAPYLTAVDELDKEAAKSFGLVRTEELLAKYPMLSEAAVGAIVNFEAGLVSLATQQGFVNTLEERNVQIQKDLIALQQEADIKKEIKQIQAQIQAEQVLGQLREQGVIDTARSAELFTQLYEQVARYTDVTPEKLQELIALSAQLSKIKDANEDIRQAEGTSLRTWLNQLINERRQFVDFLKGLAQDLERYFSDAIFDILQGTEVKFKDFFKSLKSIMDRGIADLLASEVKTKFASVLKDALDLDKAEEQKQQVIQSFLLKATPGGNQEGGGVAYQLIPQFKDLSDAAGLQKDAAAATTDAADATIEANNLQVAAITDQTDVLTRIGRWFSGLFGGGGVAEGGLPQFSLGGVNIGGGGGSIGGGGWFTNLFGGPGKAGSSNMAWFGNVAKTGLALYTAISLGKMVGAGIGKKGLPGANKIGMVAGGLGALALGAWPGMGMLLGFGGAMSPAVGLGATIGGAVGPTGASALAAAGPLALAAAGGYIGGGYIGNAIYGSPGATKWGGVGGALAGAGTAAGFMLAGAAMGSVVPIIGTIIGAAVGAIIGAFLGDDSVKQERKYAASTIDWAKTSVKSLQGNLERWGVPTSTSYATAASYKSGGWKREADTYIGKAPLSTTALGDTFEFLYRHYSWAPGLQQQIPDQFKKWVEDLQAKIQDLVKDLASTIGQALSDSFKSDKVMSAWGVFVKSLNTGLASNITQALETSFASSKTVMSVTMPLRAAIESALTLATNAEGIFDPTRFKNIVKPSIDQYLSQIGSLQDFYKTLYDLNILLTTPLTTATFVDSIISKLQDISSIISGAMKEAFTSTSVATGWQVFLAKVQTSFADTITDTMLNAFVSSGDTKSILDQFATKMSDALTVATTGGIFDPAKFGQSIGSVTQWVSSTMATMYTSFETMYNIAKNVVTQLQIASQLGQDFASAISGALKSGLGSLGVSFGWRTFKSEMGKGIADSVTSGLITAFQQTTIVQQVMMPLQDALTMAFSQAMVNGVFNTALFQQLTSGPISTFNTQFATLLPLFSQLFGLNTSITRSLGYSTAIHMASGGLITEPISGVGEWSHSRYKFGEGGRYETVTPDGEKQGGSLYLDFSGASFGTSKPETEGAIVNALMRAKHYKTGAYVISTVKPERAGIK